MWGLLLLYSSGILSGLLTTQNKFWQAINAWKSVIQIDSTNAQAYYSLGELQEKLSDNLSASESYFKAISLQKDNKIDAAWFYRLGYTLEKNSNEQNIEKIQKYYQLAIDHDKKLNAKSLGIGAFHYSRRYWTQAIQAFQKNAQIQPSAELYYKIGFSYDRNYEWNLAEEYYLRALSLDDKAEWHFRLGLAQEKQQKFLEAAQNYEAAALLCKKYTPYWFYRSAYCLEKLEKYEEAALTYLKLRKNQALPNIGVSNTEAAKRLINLVEKTLVSDFTNQHLWYRLGNLYENINHFLEAANAYRHAISRSNTLESLWYYRLGLCEYRLGNFEQACKELRNYRVMQLPHGTSEEILNKDEGFSQAAAYTEYFKILPIQPKTVLYEAFSGQGMSCNPYALFLSLFNNEEYKDWTHIWVINNPERIPEEYKKYKNIIFIKRDSDSYLRYLSSVSILVNNSNFPPYFIRKEEQKFISTWHGTPFKTLGRDMNGRFFEHKNFTRNILQSTHLLSPNPHTSKILHEKHDIKDIYQGKLIESGYPRIDLTINNSESRKTYIREILNVAIDDTLVFYAPTWRGTHKDIDFDFDKLQNDINQLSTLPNCKIIFRGHSLVQEALSEMNLDITLAPDNLDTNEILSVTDILITDYSSVLFDYLPTLRPLILYMYDLEEYTEERGLYFSSSDLPGYKCYNIDELMGAMQTILSKENLDITPEKNMVNVFTPHDNGRVSEKVWHAVLNNDYDQIKVINKIPEKKSILIYGGPFMGNGITTSIINLISNIDKNKYTISLVIEPGSIEKEEGRLIQFNKLPPDINVIARVGRMDMSLEDRYIHGLNNQDFCLPSKNAEQILDQSWSMEYQRVFGNAKFDSIVHFEGYNRFWAGVFSSQRNIYHTSIFMHNSMYEEYLLKYPYLKSIFGYCQLFNKVVSVSKLTMDLNKEKLSQHFDIPEEKFDYSNNLQYPEYTLSQADKPLLDEDKLHFNGIDKVFVTIGRLSLEKDHRKLINSFAKVLQEYSTARLLIIGEGPLKYELTQQIKNLGLQNNVFLLGARLNPFPILKNADCFVLSSNHEGQPMTLFEAMILQKNIISTDIVGSRSALEGRSGYLVENSEEGLTKGILDFLQNKLPLIKYDINQYQKEAINKFYRII